MTKSLRLMCKTKTLTIVISYANKANQIEAYEPGKGNGDSGSAQESKGITESQQFGKSLRIL